MSWLQLSIISKLPSYTNTQHRRLQCAHVTAIQRVYQHSLTCKTSSISPNQTNAWMFFKLYGCDLPELCFDTCKNVPTELRDAANTGSQQGLFQRPQLQLGVRVLSAVHRRLLVLRVRAEVGRQRQNTYGDRNQRTWWLKLNVWKELS